MLQKHINIESYFSIDSLWALDEDPFPFPHSHLLATSSHRAGAERTSFLLPLLIRALIPSWLPYPYDIITSQRSHHTGDYGFKSEFGWWWWGRCKWAVHDSWQSFTIFSSRQPLIHQVTGVTKAKSHGNPECLCFNKSSGASIDLVNWTSKDVVRPRYDSVSPSTKTRDCKTRKERLETFHWEPGRCLS